MATYTTWQITDANGSKRAFKVRDNAGAGLNAVNTVDNFPRLGSAIPSLAVTASGYTDGYVVGGKITISAAVLESGGGGVVSKVVVTDKSANQVLYDLWLFDGDPSAGTYNDHAAWTLHNTDLVKALGFISLGGSWSAAGTGGAVSQTLLDLPFKLTTGTTLYALLIARGGAPPTFASTSDLQLRFEFKQEGVKP